MATHGSRAQPLSSVQACIGDVIGDVFYIKVGGSVFFTEFETYYFKKYTPDDGSFSIIYGDKRFKGAPRQDLKYGYSISVYDATDDQEVGLVTVYGVAPPKYTYKLIYDWNGGETGPSDPTPQVTTEHSVQWTVGRAPTKAGSEFTGWYNQSNGNTYQPGDTFTTEQFQSSLVAQWKFLPHYTHDLIYHTRGGTPEPIDYHDNVAQETVGVTIPSPGPSLSPYTFYGWALSASSSSPDYQPGETVRIGPNVEANLYALYRIEVSTYVGKEWYQEQLVLGDRVVSGSIPGMTLTPVQLAEGVFITASGKPTRAGTFTIKTNGPAGLNVAQVTVIASNIMTLQYDGRGGKPIPENKSYGGLELSHEFYITGEKPVLPGSPNKKFAGWSPDPQAQDPSYLPEQYISVNANQTVTLYAIYNEAEYVHILKYNANGQGDTVSNMPPDDVYKGPDKTYAPTVSEMIPVREGYEFLGWARYVNTSPEYKYPAQVAAFSGGETLYAIWKRIAITGVTLEAVGSINRVTQGEAVEFQADVLPEDAGDKRIKFTLTQGADAASIDDITTSEQGPSSCRVVTSTTTLGDFTLRATSEADTTKYREVSIKVDKAPKTHGSPTEPLTTSVMMDLGGILSDTFYIQEGVDVDFSALWSPDEYIYATDIQPLGSGLVVDSGGNVSGRTANPGTYSIQVEYASDAFPELIYWVYVTIVKKVDKPVTAIDITGPDRVTAGERITLTATVQPVDATLPRVSFVAMNNRVTVIREDYDEASRTSSALIEGVLQGDVFIRATSGDGACTVDRKLSVIPGSGGEDTWVMDAGEGTFPNGLRVIQGPVGEEGYHLPDWSVVTRRGYRLTGWRDSAGNTSAMGALKVSGVRWTAQWTEDRRSYDLAVHPHAAVRIYRSLDEFIDLTEMCVRGGEPVVSMAENRPGQASFSAANIYDVPTKHLIADTCALWSAGGPEAVTTGMYCTIEDIQSDGSVLPLFDGFITTITPDADAGSISFVVGDRKAFLGRAGTYLRRNYYIGRQAGTNVGALFTNGQLYGDLSSIPADAQIEGPYEWLVGNVDGNPSQAPNLIVKEPSGYGGRFWKVRMPELDMDMLRFVTIKCRCDSGPMSKEFRTRGQLKVTTSAGSFTKAYPETTFSSRRGDFDIVVDFASNNSPGIPVRGPITMEMTTDIDDFGNYDQYYIEFEAFDDPRSELTHWVSSPGILKTEPRGIAAVFDGFRWTPCDATRENQLMKVNHIEGLSDTTDPTLYTPPQGRMRINYLAEDMSTVQIMSGVALAVNHYPLPNNSALSTEQTSLKVFRTGGGYAQDYLQKLADVPSVNGRMRAFRALGFQTPAVVIGTRHSIDDTPTFNLAYGGDSVSSSIPTIRFSSFSPNLTMKNRPSLVMVRGTGTTFDGQTLPLMVAVENQTSKARRRGLSVEQVLADSSVNNPLGAARAGYAQVNANDLDRWEGSIVLPDIQRDLLELDGAYAGSGVPVRIYDSRNGLRDYPARVKEARFDYNTCTTTATLVNYSVVYSSAIGDTIATADTAADVSTGASNNSLYETQYVRVVAKYPQPVNRSDLMNKVKIYHGPDNAEQVTIIDDVTFLDYPGNRTTLVAVAPPGGEGHTDGTRPYDVRAVEINNGGRINIPAPVRPDYYEGQTLIVNVDFPTR